jgi:ADP-ribose pyrophosphatase YjhB (NUDIX family)
MPQPIDVTVAAVIERDGRYLMVEEQVSSRLVFNQPAGHLEPGESLTEAVVRETLEETGFVFRPAGIVGFYLWHPAKTDAPILRVAFYGTADAPQGQPRLDSSIEGTHWLTAVEIARMKTRLRSPMVMRCIEDFDAGARYPLACLTDLRLDTVRGKLGLAR